MEFNSSSGLSLSCLPVYLLQLMKNFQMHLPIQIHVLILVSLFKPGPAKFNRLVPQTNDGFFSFYGGF